MSCDFAVVQSLSCVQLYATPWTAACQTSPSFTITLTLLKLMFIESAMPSNHLILCHPLLLLPSIFPSIRIFPDESALHVREGPNPMTHILVRGKYGNSPVVQCLGFHASIAGSTGLTPGWATKIPRAMWCGQKKTQKNPRKTINTDTDTREKCCLTTRAEKEGVCLKPRISKDCLRILLQIL